MADRNQIILPVLKLCKWVLLCLPMVIPAQSWAQQGRADPSALSYFNDAFAYIKNNFYNRNKVNFNEIHQKALVVMENAKVPVDTYKAIEYVISELKDKHTHFNATKNSSTVNMPPNVMPFKIVEIDTSYSVIELYSYSSLNLAANLKLADSLYRKLQGFVREGKKGLILDLRKMEGGSTDPFLCGLSPLIGNAELLTFKGGDKKRDEQILFENGNLYRSIGKAKIASLYLRKYQPSGISALKVIVLTGPYTASTGELIVIALKGMPNVSIVGQPTYGAPTGVGVFQLIDGAKITLATSVPYGRGDIAYTSAIEPELRFDFTGLSDLEVYQTILKQKR